ncbi:hypothetical protein FACS189437_08250 [Bacteroidia bacterium]|nr:hypothetical protein FACS189437_08250 [Bacteroidia bacterium]
MASYKPVSIPNAAFIFCRYSISILVWLSFFLHSKILLALVCLIFLLSAILKVKHAPLVWLYTVTINKIWKSADVMVEQNALFFAHTLGFILSAICLLLVCLIDKSGIWYAVLVLAVLKTISAVGFCPAAKLYDCMNSDTCCAFMKKRK